MIFGVSSDSYVKHPLEERYRKLKHPRSNIDGVWRGVQLQTVFRHPHLFG